jgi:hypothetical protein
MALRLPADSGHDTLLQSGGRLGERCLSDSDECPDEARALGAGPAVILGIAQDAVRDILTVERR